MECSLEGCNKGTGVIGASLHWRQSKLLAFGDAGKRQKLMSVQLDGCVGINKHTAELGGQVRSNFLLRECPAKGHAIGSKADEAPAIRSVEAVWSDDDAILLA